VRIIEVHNGLTGSIVEHVKFEKDGRSFEFDGMWGSSLTDATSRAIPDIDAIDLSSRLEMVRQIFEVTTKPLIFDGNTGGRKELFALNVRTLERHGVSGVVIGDRKARKGNLLESNTEAQILEASEVLVEKIKLGKASQRTEEFMIMARVESLAMNRGIDDTLSRAHAYLEAGADGIVIASTGEDADQFFDFCTKYKQLENRKPLVVALSGLSKIKESELLGNGVSLVIYSDHLIRAAIPRMQSMALAILENQCAHEIETDVMDMATIFELFIDKQ
jgi:phosphoenolpyruvate mutase